MSADESSEQQHEQRDLRDVDESPDLAFLQRFVAAESVRPEHEESDLERAEKDAMRDRLTATLGMAAMMTATAATTAGAPPVVEGAAREIAKAATWPVWIKAALLVGVGFGAGFGARGMTAASGTQGAAPRASDSVAPTVQASALATTRVVPPSLVTETIDIANLPKVPAPVDSSMIAAPSAKTGSGKPAQDAEAERLLLETARVAMRRGDREGALRLLQEHKTKFPQGQLREERDGLTVSALTLLGRTDEAAKASARFHKDYPMSLQGAAVPEATSDAGH